MWNSSSYKVTVYIAIMWNPCLNRWTMSINGMWHTSAIWLNGLYIKFSLLDLRKKNKFLLCMETTGAMTSTIESDVTHPVCVWFSSLVFTCRSSRAFMLVYALLLFLPGCSAVSPGCWRCTCTSSFYCTCSVQLRHLAPLRSETWWEPAVIKHGG